MFLLNTIAGSSPAGPTDSSSQLLQAENKIQSLESLLKSIFMGGDPNSADIDSINQQLAQAREDECNILNIQGDSLEHDPSAYYNGIKNDELLIEQQIQELQTKLNQLEPNTDITQLTKELNKLTTYRKELEDSDNFWGGLTAAHKQFEVSMQKKDEFFGGYNKLTELEGLLSFLESGKNGNEFDIDPNTTGIQTAQNITNLNDKDEIRNQITKLKTDLLDEISSVKDETWFKSFLDSSGESLSKIDEGTQALQEKINNLNQVFISMASGDLKECNTGGVTYSSISAVEGQLLRSTSYLQDLINTGSFINQIKNITSADSDTQAGLIADAKKSLLSEQKKYSQIDQVTSAMYKTMELEGLLTNLNTATESMFKIDGVDNNDISAVTEVLKTAKENETKLREESGITPETAAETSLAFTKKMNELVSGRINELNMVEQYLTQASQVFYKMIETLGSSAPDSFYFEDPNLTAIRMEIKRVGDYKTEMSETEAYWNKIVSNNTTAKPVAGNQSPPAVTLASKPSSPPQPPAAVKSFAESSGKKISNLMEIFDMVDQGESVEELKSREASITQEIKSLTSKLKTLFGSPTASPSDKQKVLDTIGELKSTLSGIQQDMSHASLMGQIGNSVKETLSKESIYQNIYSSRF